MALPGDPCSSHRLRSTAHCQRLHYMRGVAFAPFSCAGNRLGPVQPWFRLIHSNLWSCPAEKQTALTRPVTRCGTYTILNMEPQLQQQKECDTRLTCSTPAGRVLRCEVVFAERDRMTHTLMREPGPTRYTAGRNCGTVWQENSTMRLLPSKIHWAPLDKSINRNLQNNDKNRIQN